MENSPLISIIMPIFDFSDFSKDAVKSVLDQTYRNFELILTGNIGNSLMEQFPKDKRIRIGCEVNHYIDALNSGVAAAKGEFIIFTDTGIVMYEERLQIQHDFMRSHPSVDICSSTVNLNNGTKPCAMNHESMMASILFHNPIFSSSVIMKSSILKQIPRTNNKILLFKKKYYCSGNYRLEEYMLWVDLLSKGFRFEHIPDVLSVCFSFDKVKKQSISNKAKRTLLLIQSHYITYMVHKLVEEDADYFDMIDHSTKLFNKGKFNFDHLKNVVDMLYVQHQKRWKGLPGTKRKILFCIQSLQAGGAEKLLIELLKNFDYKSYNVDLLTLDGYGNYFKYIPEQVNCFTLVHAKYNLLDAYDVEIAFLEGASSVYIASRKNSAMKIVWIHCDLFHHHWTTNFYKNLDEERACYSEFDKIIFVSNEAQKQFHKLFPRLKTEQEVIYNLIDQVDINRNADAFAVKKRRFTLCTVGRLVPEKGYDHLISVIDRLVKEDGLTFDFWIIGSGYQRKQIQSLIDQHTLNDVVHLMGFKRNPYPYMRAADVFVSVSLSEGFSLVIGEALCLGLPVLSTMTAGSSELLDQGKYGLIVDQGQDSIRDGLKKIIEDEKLRKELVKKALIRSKEIFNKEQVMMQIYDLLSVSKDRVL